MRRLSRALRFQIRASGLEASLRVAVWALVSASDRLVGRARGVFLPPRSRVALDEGLADRLAARTVHLLGTLKGAFVKAGQFASIRHDVLSPGAARSLAELRDRVPALPFADVVPLLESQLGQPVHRAFAHISPDPIGAASIAQAHRARLQDGTEVVVKIQYPWIADALASDLSILRRLGKTLLWLSGRSAATIDFDAIFDEFAEGLRRELDFEQEARAAAEISANLADVTGVVVPTVRPELSTRRVLTMSFHPCVAIDDRASLAALGVREGVVLDILARAYAKQVFVDGLFHADPHPGNLFVLETPDAAENPQVLFVDFGLCRRLAPALRQALREGIYAVMQRDLDAFVARMDDMGMIAKGAEPDVRAAVASMFERLEAAGGGRGMLGASSGSVIALKDEAKRLLQETPGLRLPNDLLLYAKTLSYLFALGDALDPDADLMKLSLPYLLRFLAAREEAPG